MRIPKLSAMLAVALSAAVAAAGCSSASPSSSAGSTGSVIPVLTEGAAAFGTLNTYKNDDGYYYTPMFESLLSEETNGQNGPWLAKSWSQPNPTTYIFHLQQGVKFWNGAPMTSADVVASLDGLKKPSALDATIYAGDTFTAQGPYTVVAKTPKPEAYFLDDAGYAYIFQAKFLNSVGNNFGRPGAGGQPGGVMATGPWEIKSFDPTTGIVLTANPHYWHGKVNIKRINIDFFSTPESEALAMRTGQIDVAPYITDPTAFKNIPGVNVTGSDGCSTNALSMNTAVAPFNNLHVRLAVADVLNRADIIDAWGGFAYPDYTWIPQRALEYLGGSSTAAVTSFVHSLPSYKDAGNLQQAKLEMSQSPYPHGFNTTLQVASYSYQHTTQVGQLIASELKALGIKATVQSLPEAASLATMTAVPGKKPAMTMYNYGCSSLDPATEQQLDYELGSNNAVKGGYNVSNWGPPMVDKLIAQGSTTTGNAKRLGIYEALSRELAATSPYVAISEQGNILAMSTKYKWPSYRSWYANEDGDAFLLGIQPAS